MQLALDMQQNVFQQTNSIGISYNKSLWITVIFASDMKKPMGITLIRPKDVAYLFQSLPVNKIFDIGK